MTVEEILEKSFVGNVGGERATLRELYTKANPDVDFYALEHSDFFPAMYEMMEPVLEYHDERDPGVMAYWAKRGMVKEFHGDDEAVDWEEYGQKTGYYWNAGKHGNRQNMYNRWTSFVPVGPLLKGK